MSELNIAATERTPEIQLSAANGVFSMKGESFPEDVSAFYGQVIVAVDQMAASLADTSRALLLDTRTLERRFVPLPEGSAVLVLDSGVPRTLAASAYNQRRAECEQAAQASGPAAEKLVREAQQTAPAAARPGLELASLQMRAGDARSAFETLASLAADSHKQTANSP